jgi:uncharacterized membrane protein
VLDLVARWVHVIAGIMWVGNSLLFNWLDRSLISPQSTPQTKKPAGTIWLLHSGGFYYVEKTLLEGERVPAPLHWFKWQAYTTWLSGVLLLIVVYYAGGRAALEDPSLYHIGHGSAVMIGVGALIGSRIIYDLVNRFAPNAWYLWVIPFIAIAIALVQLLNPRAAYLHVGAMLANIMAGNVALTIVPSQHALVKSVEGGAVDPALSARAKRVSIHNNYFTFPVIALMLTSHFPALYGSPYSTWLLLVIVAAGALVRHILNVRWTFPSWKPALTFVIAAGILIIWGLARPRPVPVAQAAEPATFENARHIIDRRCAVCHSERPTDSTFGKMPGGVAFDTPEQLIARAPRIRERAFITSTMPPGNKTGITQNERALLGAWALEAKR